MLSATCGLHLLFLRNENFELCSQSNVHLCKGPGQKDRQTQTEHLQGPHTWKHTRDSGRPTHPMPARQWPWCQEGSGAAATLPSLVLVQDSLALCWKVHFNPLMSSAKWKTMVSANQDRRGVSFALQANRVENHCSILTGDKGV